MISAMLATWKSGRLCVPLDSTAPPPRLEAILRDSGATVLVGNAAGIARVPGSRRLVEHTIEVESVDHAARRDDLSARVRPDTRACLLYTSGSTGEPKGIVQSHRNLLHRARCAIASFGITPADRLSALHSPSFGGGLRDVLAALLGGATLLPFDVRRAGLGALAAWIDEERVSVLCMVVTMFRRFLATLEPDRSFSSVRGVRFGSEPLHRRDVERLRRHFPPDCLLVAAYGASEATGITEYRITAGSALPAGLIPAGYPLEGVDIRIVDQHGHDCVAGEPGEVVIGSRYLSEGYWRRPDLTHAAFAADPTDSERRTYRTGDIGRRRPDGCLEILGRKDHQVKIRGYRVHPGEIERTLADHPAVREAVVVASTGEDPETRLVAYVVPDAEPGPSAQALHQFLRARLPAYMIPAAFVTLSALPVGLNGKVDYRALPPVTRRDRTQGRLPPISPRTELEARLARLWEAALGIAPIGVTEDFFDLGGDSLLAAAVIVQVEQAMGRAIPPSALFDGATIEELAKMIEASAPAPSSLLTMLQAGDRGWLPFIMVDGDVFGDGALYCRRLAHVLGPQRPFYQLSSHGTKGGPIPPTIEAMATDHVATLRALLPEGPYCLGGYSHGALIAFEMARQLTSAGHAVPVVAVVDMLAYPGGGLAPTSRSLRRWRRRLARVRTLAGTITSAPARSRASAPVHDATPQPGAPFGRTPAWRRSQWETYSRIVRSYTPSPYSGPVVAMVARDGHHRASVSDRTLGWRRVAPQVRRVVIPGDHMTCVTRHTAVLGHHLVRYLADNRLAAEEHPSR
jgi:amino acid adenylation domain-containing protein